MTTDLTPECSADIWQPIADDLHSRKLHAAYFASDTEFIVSISRECFDHFDKDVPICERQVKIEGLCSSTTVPTLSLTTKHTFFMIDRNLQGTPCFVFCLGEDLCDKSTDLMPLMKECASNEDFCDWMRMAPASDVFEPKHVVEALQAVVKQTLQSVAKKYVVQCASLPCRWVCYQ